MRVVQSGGRGKPISATIERIALKDGWPVTQLISDFIRPDAVRLVMTEAWGGGKAHVFAMDVR